MKKIFALLLALCMVFALCACGETKPAESKTEEAAPAEEVVVEETPAEEAAPAEEAGPAEEAPAVMSYEEFAAAELDAAVVVETYVQDHESWWDGKVSVHAQSPDGAYYIYEMACSEEDAAKLLPGTKIRVSGFKGEWSGEVEIASLPIRAMARLSSMAGTTPARTATVTCTSTWSWTALCTPSWCADT